MVPLCYSPMQVIVVVAIEILADHKGADLRDSEEQSFLNHNPHAQRDNKLRHSLLAPLQAS